MTDVLDDYAARLHFVGDDAKHWSRYINMTEPDLRTRAAVAADYWLDTSPHEHTYLDAMVCARYSRLAMAAMAEQRHLIQRLFHTLWDMQLTAGRRGDTYLFDSIDNQGDPYQSEALAQLLRQARHAITRPQETPAS